MTLRRIRLLVVLFVLCLASVPNAAPKNASDAGELDVRGVLDAVLGWSVSRRLS